MNRRPDKQRAIALRLRGKSYNEIRRILGIPSKGTLSSWFRGLTLSSRARQLLAANIAKAEKLGLLRFNRNRSRTIRAENEGAYESGKKGIGALAKRELLLVGAALYWGEGTKSTNIPSPAVTLVNSDPGLIALYLRFVREILTVPEERIRAGIHIHPNLDVGEARRFWAEVTRLPPSRFYVVEQLSRASKRRRPRNILRYGTISVRVSSRVLFHKVLGYIQGLRENITAND